MHGLVDAVPADGEPVVDAAERGQDPPSMPVSSSISRTAASSLFSRPSGWPLGRHHSSRPPRLKRAMIATFRSRSDVSTTTPPAEISSTVGSEWCPGAALPTDAVSGVRFGALGTGCAMRPL